MLMTLLGSALFASSLDADRCVPITGYPEFRAKLTYAVAHRDGPRLDALFGPKGAMRVDGLSRGSLHSTDRDLTPVWRVLDDMLARGCAPYRERLLLPAMAELAETGAVDVGTWIAIDRTAMRTAPSGDANRRGWLRAGARITPEIFDAGDGFSKFWWRGRPAYVDNDDLRSPHGFRLELERIDGEWRITSFSDGV